MATWGVVIDPGYRRAIEELTPSLYWPLDAANGATDLSGNSRNGTGQGGVTIGGYTDGPLAGTDTATDLDGSNDYISSSYNPFVNGTVRTFTGWAYRDTNSGFDVVFAGGSFPNGADLYLDSGTQSVVWRPDGGGAAVTWAAAWPGNAQWVHWALVFNESGDTAALYINGALVSSQALATQYDAGATSFDLGQFGGGSHFDGKMAHVSVFEYGLTANQIAALYEAGRTISPLDINDRTNYRVREPLSAPQPPRDSQYASSSSTEGDPLVSHRYQNRVIEMNLWVFGTSQATLLANLNALSRKVGKLNTEGGELKLTTPGSTVVVYDVIGAEMDETIDIMLGQQNRTQVTLRLEAKPFGRGVPVQGSDHAETSLPCLIFTESGIEGDVPALGKLVVDEDDADDQWFLAWGLESRYFDTADPANKKLFFQAEDLTELSTTAVAVGATGASGAGSNVQRNTDLTTSYQAILSTEIDATNTHLGHVGTYRVWARLYRPTGNTGAVDVALEWAEGDFRRFTQNDAVSYAADEREGVFTLADLGLVHLPKVAQGTQRWEGRIVARSTVVGDELDVDCLFLFPVAEGYGEVRAVANQPTLTAYSARDEFDQVAGALTGKVAPVGGTWTAVASSDADDFSIITPGTVNRTAVSDANINTGRYVSVGTTNYTGISAQVDVYRGSHPTTDVIEQGLFVRLVDISNWLSISVGYDTVSGGNVGLRVAVRKRIAGTVTTLTSNTTILNASTDATSSRSALIRLDADSAGRWTAYAWRSGGDPEVIASGYDADLATGGTLATGKIGIFDAYTSASALTRTYDNFVARTIQADAAIFASQSLELRHDRVIREDSSGAIWTPVSDYQGDFLLVPPAGQEGRQSRFILKASRNLPESGADSGIDDISARLTVTPRYLQLPD